MTMRGMGFHMADAATFTDCATGVGIAVANNAQLERDYAAAQDANAPGTAGGGRALYAGSNPG